ncbi:MAG: hypothetical protein AB7I25_10120 [Vicinamibacterales bacterium]
MPRDDAHPPILIAISWQALGRAHDGRTETLLANCTVVILFATFFIEANLNYLIRRLGRTADMRTFFGGRHPGLGDKLAWFYNEYGARARVTHRGHSRWKGVHRKVRARFPGFAKLHRFRNDLSHGVVNGSARSLVEAKRLRQRAKDIVGDLYSLAAKAGHTVRQPTNYQKAIGLK